jgi:hypothetical protein
MKIYTCNGLPGCVFQCVSLLGGPVALYQAEQSGRDGSAGRWIAVCEAHGSEAAFTTKAAAEEQVYTASWCARCQEGIPAPQAVEGTQEGHTAVRWWAAQGVLALRRGKGRPPLLVSAARDHNPLIFQGPASFVSQFSATVAVYSGCEMGCLYCYLPDVQHGLPTRLGGWGNYTHVRLRAVDYLLEQRERLAGAHLFMSATTDPYQRVEQRYRLTRALLEALLDIPFAFLLISTRGGLLRRDLDLYEDERMRGRVEIGISIPSDEEQVHAALEPTTPSFAGRFALAAEVRKRGIPVRIHAAPLAVHSPSFFQKALAAADWAWLDGAGHGARESEPEKSLLYDYAEASRLAQEATGRLGAVGRIGFGRRDFGNRWDPARGLVVKVAPRAGQPAGVIPASSVARREGTYAAT